MIRGRTRALALVAILCSSALSADESMKILRPTDRAALASGDVDVIATAPGGTLEIDGKAIEVEQPFPNVFHTRLKLPPGEHRLSLTSTEGRKEIRFFVGTNPGKEYTAFRVHPPGGADCTKCHELTRRGRFHFKGGCFDCHQTGSFAKIHTHTPEVLNQCGLCHNAHGSSAKSLLVYAKETACKQCHN